MTRFRFQLDNHLGSAMLELDQAGNVITYEEYHPFGSTAFHSARGAVEVSPKRYRYTGKERDEETGLYYHGARYYAPWLGRWTAADPLGLGGDGPGLYNYTRGSPITLRDPNGMQTPQEEELSTPQYESSSEYYGSSEVAEVVKEPWFTSESRLANLPIVDAKTPILRATTASYDELTALAAKRDAG